ncbi:cell cycle checkpoint protein RAD1 isoform X1 [Stigmatopora nigra]
MQIVLLVYIIYDIYVQETEVEEEATQLVRFSQIQYQKNVCVLTIITMPLLTHSQDDDEQYVLVASLDNVRNLSNILKAIAFKDHALFTATRNGLKVTVEDTKCLQANAFIQAEIFQEFTITEDQVGLQINLTVLQDCLSIFGGTTVPGGMSTTLRLCYKGYGYPLTLFLEEGGVVTVCKIQTQEPEEPIDFEFNCSNVTNKVILLSESLKEAFSELDMTSEVLQIIMSPSQPYFRLSTFGNAGSAHYDYPKDSDMMELFHCTTRQSNRYRMALLTPSTKALALSCKVSVRMDSRGVLSLQYMVRNDDGQICFVEYYCCPDEEVDDEN